MRNLFATLIVCAILAGCAADKKLADVPYTDQRTVTTRPAPANGRKADVLVRVCELQGAPGLASPGSAPPADAKVLASVETSPASARRSIARLDCPSSASSWAG